MSSVSGSQPGRQGEKPAADADGDEGTFEPTRSGGQLLLRTPVEFKHGDLLSDRYQIERLVGNGASGSVFQAFDRAVREVIAIKILKPELSADVRWVERLGTELRHARRLQHPNVCRVFDLGQADSHWFLTMEYASEGSLRQRMRAGAATRPFEARVADARSVIAGLAAIHATGIIHRDVKPENVLCMEDGRLVVSDFGLAVAPDQQTYYSEMAGTPSYMAPEVVIGDKATCASDVWSLGVMLHEILYGKRPEWDVGGGKRKLKPIVTNTSSKVERALAQVVADCLIGEGDKRLRDAGEVEKRFAAALLGQRRSWWTRRRKMGAALGSIALATTVIAGARIKSQRADSSPSFRGTSADWAGIRPVISAARGQKCVDLLPDRRTVRVVWMQPAEPVDYDLATGVGKPSPLLPETFVTGCPRLAPDGRALLFAKRTDTKRESIFLSRSPDGRDAQRITEGRLPVWLPNGKEFAYTYDGKRGAVSTLDGNVQLIQDNPPLQKFVRAIATNASGTRIAFLYTEPVNGGLVEIHSYPSLQLERAVAVNPAASNSVSFNAKDDLVFGARDRGATIAVRLTSDGNVHRVGAIPGMAITHALPTTTGYIVASTRLTKTVFHQAADGSEREVARGTFASVTSSRLGDIAIQRASDDGYVILFRHRTAQAFSQLSPGPMDAAPTFSTSSEVLAFIRSASKTIVVCRISSDPKPACTDVAHDPLEPRAVYLSTSGNNLAYVTRFPMTARLKLVVPGKSPTDLGPDGGICRPVWESDRLLWILDAVENAWIQRDVLADPMITGKRVPAPPGDAQSRCALVGVPSRDRARSVRSTETVETDVRVTPNDGAAESGD